MENVYQMVTDRIVAQLKEGIIPWQKPWTVSGSAEDVAISFVTRRPYSFVNQMLLGRPGEWLTWKQIGELGGKVRKGAKAGIVVFYKQLVIKDPTRKVKDEDGNEVDATKRIPLLKYYNVFHLSDVEGIDSKIVKGEKPSALEPVEEAEEVITAYVSLEDGLTFICDKESDRAYYSPGEDKVVVPQISQYAIVEEYYSTTFHELTHSTLKESRCNREAENAHAFFGNEDYSREELVAEMGSAMLCNRLGLDAKKAFKNSVAYIQGWLKELKNDDHMIVWAASRAEKAAKYILNEA